MVGVARACHHGGKCVVVGAWLVQNWPKLRACRSQDITGVMTRSPAAIAASSSDAFIITVVNACMLSLAFQSTPSALRLRRHYRRGTYGSGYLQLFSASGF